MDNGMAQVLESVFGRRELDAVSVEEIRALLAEFPSFNAGHYLLSLKLKGLDAMAYAAANRQTALYFNNPLWLQHLLEDGQPEPATNTTAEDHSGYRPTPVFRESTPGSFEDTASENNPARFFPEKTETAQDEDRWGQEDTTTVNDAAHIVQEDTPTVNEEVHAAQLEVPTINEVLERNGEAAPSLNETLHTVSDEEVAAFENEETTADDEGTAADDEGTAAENEGTTAEDEETTAEDEGTVGGNEEIVEENEALLDETYGGVNQERPAEPDNLPQPDPVFEDNPAFEWSEDAAGDDDLTPLTDEPGRHSNEIPAGISAGLAAAAAELAPGKPAESPFDEKKAKSIVFEPYHTIDYFASQGIKLVLEDNPPDSFGRQLKSFTEWLKTMKRLPVQPLTGKADETETETVKNFAAHSVEDRDILTETMAEVLVKQGMYENAIAIYGKLSLIYPLKSAYFAARIEQLKASGK